ncbi:MAG: DNA polymerase III subunit beta [Candidatus Levybacteria bacterium]|nr:DNA polymerase III subunit beta [Candidatus Levybacteria bacterium]
MLAEILVENIENILPLLAKILPAHSQIPILSHILIDAKNEGLFITATNLEFGAQIKIPAKIIENGKAALPGKYFIELISSFPKEKFTIQKDKEKVDLVTRDSKFTLQTLPAEEFPKLFDDVAGEKIHITKDLLEKAFSKVLLSVSQEETRPELTGVCLVKKEGKEEIVTTDGYRLSLFKSKTGIGMKEDGIVILSSKLIQELVSLKKEGELYIDLITNQALFETGEIVLVGRMIAGRYPQYEKILPKAFKTKITVDKNQFYQETRLAAVLARENANILKLVIKDEKIILSARSSGVGEGQGQIDVVQEGDDTEISFNARYLLDFLKQCEGEEVVMELNSSLEPAKFFDSTNPNYFHIIMPVRVQD